MNNLLRVSKRLFLLALAVLQLFVSQVQVHASPWTLPQRREPQRLAITHETQMIREAIATASIVGWYSISFVSLPEGVLLQGLVDSSDTGNELYRVVRDVTGRRVVNQLKLRPRLQDGIVQQRLLETLEMSYPEISRHIDVSVSGGIAHLWGDLGSRRQVDTLLATVLMVEGVRDIKSHISVGGNPYVGYAMTRWKE